ncbi:mandelate racemase/muconate lactonizing enzyme family protein [Prevotella sp. CAG:1124]|nr:mandelate racemase/muconate lactonizing enzyme family protein [Prevotella sp. CAG:1124]
MCSSCLLKMKYKIKIVRRVLHFKQPAGTSRGIYTERTSWFLELTSPDKPGCIGIGECAPLPGLSCDYVTDYGDVLRRFCDDFEQTGQIDYVRMRDYPSMLFGLETALRHFNVGQTALFNTPFGRGEEGIPINGLVWMGTYEEMLGRIEEKIAMGFRCIKLKVGAIDFDRELDLVKRIRERFPSSEMELRLDANGGFAPDEALYKLELLSQYSIHSIEQPIKAHKWSYMAELCRESPLPIALDEELIGITDPSMMGYMLNVIRPAYIIIKPSLHGGMYGTMKWIEAAGEHNVKTWITSALESNVGLNAIAHLAAHVYGPHITMPQGLGTGQLFTDNIEMPVEIRGDKLFYNP